MSGPWGKGLAIIIEVMLLGLVCMVVVLGVIIPFQVDAIVYSHLPHFPCPSPSSSVVVQSK